MKNRINKFEILNDQKQNQMYCMYYGCGEVWNAARELCHQTENKTLTLLLAYTSRLSDRIKSHFHHHQHQHQPQIQPIQSPLACVCVLVLS